MIGVFDSGSGGLTVLEALRRKLRRRDFLYVADNARLPYGNRTPAEISAFAGEMAAWLWDEGAEGIVVACNTASALALTALRRKLPVPVWGMVDAGVEAATRATCTGRVAVLATQATVASGVFQRKLSARGFAVWAQACPALVHAAEEQSPDAEVLVRHYLREMPRVDTLLLGCTHFPLLRRAIQRVAGPRVQVVDGAEYLAGRVAEEMEDEGSGLVRRVSTGDWPKTLFQPETRPDSDYCSAARPGR